MLSLCLCLPALASCGGDGTAPGPSGDLQATVVSPEGLDGAALVELVGPVSDVTAPGADTVLTRIQGDTTWAFAARRTPGTVIFHFRTPPGESARGRVLQVADGENRSRDVAAYRLEISVR